jgi:GNAT superfamily N-acetyltransferase
MADIIVRPVASKREKELFLTFPWKIFRGDPLWVPPLLSDLRAATDPTRGVFFQRGTAEFFIAWQNGKPVGTICAAEDRDLNMQRGKRECIFGFCNFIDDYQVFQALVDKALEWALQHKLDTLTGPFNLDYEDNYGVLVSGRSRPGALMTGYSPEYYLPFYEKAGFSHLRGDNLAFALDLEKDNPALNDLSRMAERVKKQGRFTVRGADFAHWEQEIDRVHSLINISLAHLPDFRPWPREVIFNSLAPFRKVADPELILYTEENGKTVGWLPGIPDLNEVFIHTNGLRYPWDYLSLLWWMKRARQCLTIKSVLLPPEYWGTGVIILLFDEMYRRAKMKGYKWVDASLTSDDNPRTPALAARMGAVEYKRVRVFTKPVA